MGRVQIKDTDGNVISDCQNLRSLFRRAGKVLVEVVGIDRRDDGSGKLYVRFDDWSTCVCDWASFSVLREHVRRWRNVHGATLLVNGGNVGTVRPTNPALTGDV